MFYTVIDQLMQHAYMRNSKTTYQCVSNRQSHVRWTMNKCHQLITSAGPPAMKQTATPSFLSNVNKMDVKDATLVPHDTVCYFLTLTSVLFDCP